MPEVRDPVVEFVATLVAIAAGIVIVVIMYFVMTARPAHADQPICTGDRHYDGVACCLPDPSETTTTTTLPDDDAGKCPDVPACPACPSVNCGDGTTNTYTITVNRCPEYAAPRYVPCRRVKVSTKHPNGLVCPRKATPHRVLVPVL